MSTSPKRGAPAAETFEEVLDRRLGRRSFLKGAAAVTGSAVAAPLLILPENLRASRGPKQQPDKLLFEALPLTQTDTVSVSPGYTWSPLARWGDPLFANSPEFNPYSQTPESQAMQVGYNCDFLGYFPLPQFRSENPNRALLTINHEYTNPELMFPGYVSGAPTRLQVDTELAAHGLSVVELRVRGGNWEYVRGSGFNRRITGFTAMQITGPAAGHPLVGTSVQGMLNNCGGGKTPWGTLLTAEENFNQYFANRNSMDATDPRRAIHERYGLTTGSSERRWENYHERFDLALHPNEPFKFGWVVEIDPYDPDWVPRKRTALGRTKHEAATVAVSRAGKAVVYSGDDERFDYVYKFVSTKPVSSRPQANFDLLDSGTLYVARFNDDGSGDWIPMIPGGPLASWTLADILINTRGAADLLGGTKMDRPEDIQTNEVGGKVYAVFTNNSNRGTTGNPGTDAANPRAGNRDGHIIEITESNGDHGSTRFGWEIFLLCGDPTRGDTYYAGFDKNKVSPIACPDNITFDKRGNLWIATDGLPSRLAGNDGLFGVPTDGSERGYLRQLASSPTGSEVASLEFSNDNEAIFLSIQHPGEGGTFTAPASLFPDGVTPPRPTVVVITKEGAGSKVIGS